MTDGKWLTFVVEQLLSNALKYTGQDGTVRIYRDGDDLCIRDRDVYKRQYYHRPPSVSRKKSENGALVRGNSLVYAP